MPPSFAFQDAALLLQMADEVAALHAANERPASFETQPFSPAACELCAG
jgi:hypothetical protein